MRYRELAKRLRRLGCTQLRAAKGSHVIWYNPAADKQAVIPDWGGKDLRAGTVRAILRDLAIDRKDFGPIK
jgi:predicted RNA binding protein YcfA (HicA-like mRNA interferase family)